MMIRDAFLVGLPLGCGMSLIVMALIPFLRRERAMATTGKIREFHITATRRLADRGLLKIPGIRLASSTRGWVIAEAICIASTVAAIAWRPGLRQSAFLVGGSFVSGVMLVYISLRGESRRQVERIRDALPTAAFLYSLLLESGMGQHAALAQVAKSLPPGPLPAQLHEIDLSRAMGIPRAEAFERARARVPLDDYRLFLDFIRQGERLGTGLSQGLRELSAKMLEDREHRAEATAQRAAVKLLVPLVLFIFPSVFLIVLSPVILSLLETLGK